LPLESSKIALAATSAFKNPHPNSGSGPMLKVSYILFFAKITHIYFRT